MMETINILYSSDQNYAKQLAVSMVSLISNSNEDEFFKIHIIDNGIYDKTKTDIRSLLNENKAEIIWLNFDNKLDALNLTGKFPRSAFARLFIADMLGLDKVIYIDCDMIVLQSLSPLWNMNLSDNLVMAVQDSVDISYRRLVGLKKENRYFNSGFLVINVSEWRKQKIAEQCIQYAHRWNGDIPHNDQGILNAVCKDKVKILPPCYNLQNPMIEMSVKEICKLGKISNYYSQREIDNAVNNPVVVHFTEEFYNRPWFTPCTHPYKHLYLKYASLIPWHGDALSHPISRNAKIMAFFKKYFSFYGYLVLMRTISYKRSKRYGKK